MFQPDFTAFDWKMQQGVRKTIVYLAVKHNPNVILRSGHWITSWQWRNLWSSRIFYLFLVCDHFRRLGQRGSFTDKNLFFFLIAFFWGHAMPWDLMYGISNHHWAVLLFVVVAPFGVWSQYSSPFEVILYHIVSVWEKMQTWFTLFWWETLLKDSFTELSHTQGHQGFSQIASGFKSKISRRLLDCHWHGLDPRVVIAWFDLSLLKEDDPGRSLSSQSGSHLECVMMRKSSFASGVIDNKRRAVVDTEMGWCC